MSESNSMMAASMAVSSVNSAASAYAQSEAMRQQGEYQQHMAKMNADLAERDAKDAIKRGDKEAAQAKKKAQQMLGEQRAAMAAQGIEVNDGSALAIQEDTAALSAQDQMTIRNNAYRQAWGFRVQAENYLFQGDTARAAANTQANQTLVTGGLQALSSGYAAGYYGMKDSKIPKKEDKKDESLFMSNGAAGPKNYWTPLSGSVPGRF